MTTNYPKHTWAYSNKVQAFKFRRDQFSMFVTCNGCGTPLPLALCDYKFFNEEKLRYCPYCAKFERLYRKEVGIK